MLFYNTRDFLSFKFLFSAKIKLYKTRGPGRGQAKVQLWFFSLVNASYFLAERTAPCPDGASGLAEARRQFCWKARSA